MCRRRLLYVIGFFFLVCLVGCWGLWFAFLRPIIPNGEVGEVQFENRVDHTDGGEEREYEIGVFFVPENRLNPDSRVIAIDYARFPAKEKKGPPIFMLPGGPGNKYVGKTPDVRKVPQLEKLRALGVSAQRDEKFHRILDNPFHGGDLRHFGAPRIKRS